MWKEIYETLKFKFLELWADPTKRWIVIAAAAVVLLLVSCGNAPARETENGFIHASTQSRAVNASDTGGVKEGDRVALGVICSKMGAGIVFKTLQNKAASNDPRITQELARAGHCSFGRGLGVITKVISRAPIWNGQIAYLAKVYLGDQGEAYTVTHVGRVISR